MSDAESVVSESMDVIRSGDGSESYRPYDDDEFESSKSETSRKSTRRTNFQINTSNHKNISTQVPKKTSPVLLKDRQSEASHGYSQNFEEEDEENYYDNDFESQSHDISAKSSPVVSAPAVNNNPLKPQIMLSNGKLFRYFSELVSTA